MNPNASAAQAPDLERLMGEHGDTLLRLCYLYLKDHQLAEDALQETLIRVYSKYHTFKGQSSEKTWMTRIAINVCKSLMRKRSFSEYPTELSAMPEEDYDGAEEQALENIKNAQLYDAVLSLQPIYREVILLYYYGNLPINEIALALKTREGTVKTRLMRARAHLSKTIGEELDP